jgi:hypothetical protein
LPNAGETAPPPDYVSLQTALHRHGLIEPSERSRTLTSRKLNELLAKA